MNLSDFDFDLPAERIAQRPLPERDRSRLMVLNRRSGETVHRLFSELPEFLVPGDVLVMNDTKVRPVRLSGKKPTGGRVDVLLVRQEGPLVWEALVKGVHSGRVLFSNDLEGVVISSTGHRCIEFNMDPGPFLDEHGLMPLPPYIRRAPDQSDRIRYQTVYASEEGAIAAPTAGLHFTDEVLARLKSMGVTLAPVTLHVGIGTFLPVKVDDITDHRMLPESYRIPPDSAEIINGARKEGRRIIAVGTTSTRTLEAAFQDGAVRSGEGSTRLFIYPGYAFQTVTGILTNFHLPKGTPLMLAAAFAGLDPLLRAYREAVEESYRFFSYGDAMLIL